MAEKYNKKQRQILDKGKELFWKHGFKRVSVEEISREAGVSKMTFYKYFPNKAELAIAVMDGVFDQSIRKIQGMGGKGKSPEANLEEIIQMKFEGTTGMSEEFIKDLYADQEGSLKEYMEKKTAGMFNEVVLLYERGKEEGWVRKNLHIPFLLYFTRKSMEIFTKEETPPYFENPQEMIMEITRLFIYGIAPER